MFVPRSVVAVILVFLIGLTAGGIGAYAGWLNGYNAGTANAVDNASCIVLDTGAQSC